LTDKGIGRITRFWTTDGTVSGTKDVAKLSSYGIDVEGYIVLFKDKLFFRGYRDEYTRQAKPELLYYDPVADSVKVFKTTKPIPTDPHGLMVEKNRLYFHAENPDYPANPSQEKPNALWKTDGTPQNTSFVKGNFDFFYGLIFSNTEDVFFALDYGSRRYWITNGMQAGTKIIEPTTALEYINPAGTAYIVYKDNFIFRQNFTSAQSNDEVWILRLNTPTATNETKKDAIKISIYPNPATNSFHIDDSSNEGSFSVEIYNLTGSLIKRFSDVQKHQPLDVSLLQEGLYVLKYRDSNNKIAVRKLILSR
jgi:Secretion system C-terminal sorting domain